jgi:hypothetical protein
MGEREGRARVQKKKRKEEKKKGDKVFLCFQVDASFGQI